MSKYLIISLALLLPIVGCQEKRDRALAVEPEHTIVERDLAEIKSSGKLVALTDFSSSSYFIYKGVPMGFEFELLEHFADYLGVDLSIEIVNDMDSVIDYLQAGDGDIIAANFTMTIDRSKQVLFSDPVLETKQVLIQRMPEKWYEMTREHLETRLIRSPKELIGKTVHVRKNSAFYPRLQNLMDEVGGVIDVQFADNAGTEKLIEQVSTGEISYTIADENIAILNQGYYPNIDIRTPISFAQNISWAARLNSKHLIIALNEWLEEFRTTQDFAMIYLKYFKARTQHKERVLSEFSSLKGDKISPYDAIIRKEAERLGWDWKLIAAMIYQESRFIPDAEAWTGASGLMQLVPETAARFGADSLQDPAENIHAGVSFLLSLQAYWEVNLADSTQQKAFILGSYNVGLGHVLDAVRLADKYGSDPHKWEDVAIYLELKAQPKYYKDEVVKHGYCRGQEPVMYVKSIMQLWDHYRNTPI